MMILIPPYINGIDGGLRIIPFLKLKVILSSGTVLSIVNNVSIYSVSF